MKNSYWLPSGTYNIILTKDELNELLENGRITMFTGRNECTVGRAYFDGDHMQTAYKKDVFNSLCMELNAEDVGKDDCGVHYVQYLHIIVKE